MRLIYPTIEYATVCSGIEAPSVAFKGLPWQATWFSEIEPFPCTVLAHHYPEVPNIGNMLHIEKQLRAGTVTAPSVLIGGTPCQSFSVAGMRSGLSDERGALTIAFVRIADAIDEIRYGKHQPGAVIWWENVPGVLSSKDNAFGCFLGALAGGSCELQPPGRKWGNAGCVYGSKRTVAWRVLDAQYFGLAQRRKRVFVVASDRDGTDPSTILFEWDGVRWDTAPGGETRQDTTASIGASFTASSFGQYREDVGTLRVSGGDLGGGSESLIIQRSYASIGASTTNNDIAGYRMRGFGDYVDDNMASTMKARDHKDATDLVVHDHAPVAFQRSYYANRPSAARGTPSTISGTLTQSTGDTAQCVATSNPPAVRRLTPVEYERLQGFPDNYTAIPWRGKPATECPDGHRYKALGNSMAVPVMRWIGKRIQRRLICD